MKTEDQAATAWEQSSGKAAANYTEGVNNYSGDWAGATLRQKSVMQTNWQAALARGDWDRGVSAVGTNGWKTRTQAKVANYSQGFSAGASRQRAAIAKIIAAERNIVGSLPPRGTYEQNKARATAVMDGLHSLKGQLGAS